MTISTGLRAINLSFFLDGFFRGNNAAAGLARALLVCDWHGFNDQLPFFRTKKQPTHPSTEGVEPHRTGGAQLRLRRERLARQAAEKHEAVRIIKPRQEKP